MCRPEGRRRQKRHRWNGEGVCKRCGNHRNPAARPLLKKERP